jgi:phage terminase Nu1 subunit (DNA packaging protein)
VWVNDKQLINGQDISKQMTIVRKNGMRHLTLYGTRVAISDLRMRAADVTAGRK